VVVSSYLPSILFKPRNFAGLLEPHLLLRWVFGEELCDGRLGGGRLLCQARPCNKQEQRKVFRIDEFYDGQPVQEFFRLLERVGRLFSD